MKQSYDVIVIGAGHAGCEAALAAARLGKKTLVMATCLETVAFCACNPSIGGTAKGQIVREIDALGGEMAKNADKALLQMRMLNLGKGPAVHSPRAQVDKYRYHAEMKRTLEREKNLYLRQAEAVDIEAEEEGYKVVSAVGTEYLAQTVILACGVYLGSRIIVGPHVREEGPCGFSSAKELSKAIIKLGHSLRRFKTGTPARVHGRSIDFTKTVLQKGDDDMPAFSYSNDKCKNSAVCYLTYSTPQTKEIILKNKHLAPLFSGGIDGVGPRYCPSIEDKVVRFSDKERHQVFLEPEGRDTEEWYVQGVSSSMPADIQYGIYRTLTGLENVEIMRDAYAIEYDCIDPTTLYPTLMSKYHRGLFFAGQINGTSGYEEAAGQGLLAGINAARFLEGKECIVLGRERSYIGVLIDDITLKGTNEPYRMMTGRAEYRLILRWDNADMRLTPLGREIGLVGDEAWERFLVKREQTEKVKRESKKVISPKEVGAFTEERGLTCPSNGISLAGLIKRGVGIKEICRAFGVWEDVSPQALETAETDIRYEGYIAQAQEQIAKNAALENAVIPDDTDYKSIEGLRLEARQKLDAVRPKTVGMASRISGVSPADINVLIVWLALNGSRRKPGTEIYDEGGKNV